MRTRPRRSYRASGRKPRNPAQIASPSPSSRRWWTSRRTFASSTDHKYNSQCDRYHSGTTTSRGCNKGFKSVAQCSAFVSLSRGGERVRVVTAPIASADLKTNRQSKVPSLPPNRTEPNRRGVSIRSEAPSFLHAHLDLLQVQLVLVQVQVRVIHHRTEHVPGGEIKRQRGRFSREIRQPRQVVRRRGL